MDILLINLNLALIYEVNNLSEGLRVDSTEVKERMRVSVPPEDVLEELTKGREDVST